MVGEREVVKDAVCPRKGGTMRLTGFHLLPSETSTKSVFSLYLTTDFAVSVHGFKVYCEVSPLQRRLEYLISSSPSGFPPGLSACQICVLVSCLP
ncbi:CUB and sushi domain-containing protein 1-like isoform X2 [Mirounga angustirostris]|uniref:CUB and sushi domain-containing protein 1-like isoform X2 n=1 Tax=Mirounga angustirostris TaxID=9716 RepID=UPI00313F301D